MLTLERARGWYSETDAVHGFDHIERVYSLCEIIGEKEGADLEILRAAALLHDARGSHPGLGQRENHHVESAAFAQEILSQEGWPSSKINAVKHCILSHRFRKDADRKSVV